MNQGGRNGLQPQALPLAHTPTAALPRTSHSHGLIPLSCLLHTSAPSPKVGSRGRVLLERQGGQEKGGPAGHARIPWVCPPNPQIT